MFTYGQQPWLGMTGAQLLTTIDAPQLGRLPTPLLCPRIFTDLMQKCWAHAAEQRPSMRRIVHRMKNDEFQLECVKSIQTNEDECQDHLQFDKEQYIIVLDKR